ncbi:MAG: DnaJ C-terminal domain-containing protein [Bacteriovorax sp.]|nr:DnaJ C-terminal domain-containing protein [Bacteriovorax sp.]
MLNPYEILGVSQTATLDEIKKAYRQLAKKNHPDLNPGNKKAEEKFKEISHANDLIGTAEARAKFDSGEINEKQYQEQSRRQSNSGPRSERYAENFGNQFGGENFFEDLFGRNRNQQAPKAARDTNYKMNISFQESIIGSEKVITLPNGKNLQIKIPAGINSGTKLRFKAQGIQGPDEHGHGDALIEIQVDSLEGWIRTGLDIEMELGISFIEGILGADIAVETMYGSVMLKIPAGVSTGSKLRIKGKGVKIGHEVGNQIVKLKVVLPKIITPELSAAIANLKVTFDYNPRGES